MKRARIGQRTARIAFCVVAGLFGCACAFAEDEKPDRGKAKHVVLIVWDGMRPDFVTEENTPNLVQLAAEGVSFLQHHSVFPTVTNVNATALATGVHPGRSGVIANYEYRPAIDRGRTLRTEELSTIRKGDKITGGKYLGVPTIAEMVQASGGRTVIAGTKTAPLLFDRKYHASSKHAAADSVTLIEGATLPDSAHANLLKLLGPFPTDHHLPAAQEDLWTTRALTKSLWQDGLPDLSVLWLAEPDRTQHADGLGTDKALAAIKSSDANLAFVLRALETKGARDLTDILIVSDHGFSTVVNSIHVANLLASSGFDVVGHGKGRPGKGQIRVVGNGGTDLFYIAGHDPEVAGRLVEWLQQSDFASVIFSRAGLAGTFPLAQVHLETEFGPDVIATNRSDNRVNQHAVAGMLMANAKDPGVVGTHGSLSPFDVHNILFAAGPDFPRGTKSELPSSNLDVAPTILHILGIVPPHPLDGRILSEALVGGETLSAKTETIEVTRPLATGEWRQSLRLSKVGEAIYVDEGNGGVSSD